MTTTNLTASSSTSIQTVTVWTCTPNREEQPSIKDWRLLYAFLEYEEAVDSPYGEWIWEIELELPEDTEGEYCYSSGLGDKALSEEWAIHPYKPWIMYSPELIRRCRLVSAPGCQ